MPRKLFWQVTSTTLTPRTSAAAHPSKRRRLPSPPPSPSTDYHPYRAVPHRPSSSSPPPASQLAPPTIAFMLPADDAYITVEDELYATAQLFTRHLHHAEYKRLQARAQSRQPSQASSSLELSVGSAGAVDVVARKHRVDALVQAGGGEPGRRAAPEDDDDGTDLVIEDRRLAGLMFASGVDTKARTKLTVLGARRDRGGSRASRGFGRSEWAGSSTRRALVTSSRGPVGAPGKGEEAEGETDDEDLDAGVSNWNGFEKRSVRESAIPVLQFERPAVKARRRESSLTSRQTDADAASMRPKETRKRASSVSRTGLGTSMLGRSCTQTPVKSKEEALPFTRPSDALSRAVPAAARETTAQPFRAAPAVVSAASGALSSSTRSFLSPEPKAVVSMDADADFGPRRRNNSSLAAWRAARAKKAVVGCVKTERMTEDVPFLL